MFRRRSLTLLVALVAAVGLVASACGNDDDSSSGNGASTTGAQLSGEPIRIAGIGSTEGTAITQPEVEQALMMATDSVNARGGVDGRPLELDFCDDNASSDGALECARQIQDDESIVASVGAVSVSGQDYGSALGDAGVAIVGPFPSAFWEVSAPTSFPFIGGTLPLFVGLGQLGKDYERVVLLRIDIDEAAPLGGVIESTGLELADEIAMPVTTPDVSTFVNQALEGGTDAVLIALAEPLTSQVIQAVFQQGGGDVTVLASGDQLTDESLTALGPATEIVRGDLSLPPPSAADQFQTIAEFNDDREAYNNDTLVANTLTINAYAAVRWFADAATQMLQSGTDVTRANVLTMMEGVTNDDFLGLTAPVTFSQSLEAGGIPLPRLFNVSGYFANANADDGWTLDPTDLIDFNTGETES